MKTIKLFTFIGITLLSANSFAQQSYKLETGLAQPLSSPQSDRFSMGGSLGVKGFTEIAPYFDAGLGLSFLGLPSQIDSIKPGTAIGGGLSFRLKVPEENNTIIPWVDTDLQLVRTGHLNRVSASFAVGLTGPLNENQSVRTGPFVRYQHVFQLDKPGYDTTDAHVLIAGVSFEFGKGDVAKSEPKYEQKPEVKVPEKEIPKVEGEQLSVVEELDKDNVVVLNQRVQFLVNSSVLLPKAKETLKEVVKLVNEQVEEHADWHLLIEGHASVEGPPEPYNMNLSKRRAESVLVFLKAAGMPLEKMATIGYSSTRPMASNETETGRTLNRRVQFVLTISAK